MAYIEFGPKASDLLFSTVRLETTRSDGHGAGTAFLFACEENGSENLFMVTNKHVIEGALEGSFFFTESDGANPLVGHRVDVRLSVFASHWHLHPDPNVDIAVLPYAAVEEELRKTGKRVHIQAIPQSVIPSAERLAQIGVFSDVVFIGYPSGHYDQANLMPITRRGTMATPPELDYDGRPVVLIDASVFPGSSGSPVFIIHSGPMFIEGTRISFASRMYFLGTVAEVLIRQESGRLEFRTIPTALVPTPVVNQMIDLGVVYRSSEVLAAAMDYLSTLRSHL
jgi:S1-C subfamily serine protease